MLTLYLHRDVNNFIMDYLITQGYPQAAERFAREAKISLNFDLEIKSQTIQDRVQIREAIHRGDLQSAIELINELDPQVCDCVLLFSAPFIRQYD